MAVLDASVILQIPFEEEFTRKARLLVKEADSIEAPHILWYEVGNGIVKLHRRKLIDEHGAVESLGRLMQIPIRLVETDIPRTLGLALELQITFYDAAYVDAALQLGTELYTADNLLYERALRRIEAKHIGRI